MTKTLKVAGDFFGPMEDGTYYFVNIDKYSRWAAAKNVSTVAGHKSIPYLKDLFADKGVPDIYKIDKNEALQYFLRTYRETPHATTKVAPAMLLMGYSKTSGIPTRPRSVTDYKAIAKLHETARDMLMRRGRSRTSRLLILNRR